MGAMECLPTVDFVRNNDLAAKPLQAMMGQLGPVGRSEVKNIEGCAGVDCSLCRQSAQCRNIFPLIVVFDIAFFWQLIMNEADFSFSDNLLQHRILFDTDYFQVGFSIECLLTCGDLLHTQGDPVYSTSA